ncbi:hypothetical protein SPRG_01380 [Saprolegnia parasitica CBS 223.65]|uniref:Uncharacterized protein n=1 Tax=Saprolegnia parasitica (strain CBS 223.65) TaxID=695850 RepID=A0A067CTS9_SAPPC|nr:hypothetical protein SPRG_01380 [Saprolegnia parasitica CBS 223.65]KDO34109.1 hypothetical protein SPRG_01380 [Saprolegnia parasitica CBS 223.65]|eukprot:XP_012194988.1 hypothetical protein SPRG_01380 [Saprolegnia parasitica CBS 223.65]
MMGTEAGSDGRYLPLGLPAVPPSNDPQRLLAYVLQVLPQYTAMELSATHYRLYTQQLRTEVDRWKQQATVTMQRLLDEEDKRVFMERYAAEVVKERNDVLHHKGAKKHKVWHNCCRQHASYDLDVTPSIVSLRGEKLTECSLELKQARASLLEKDRLLDAAHELLNTKQIDFDAFVSAARKEKEQLEHQLATRAGLQGSQERRLAEVERQLWDDQQALAEKNAGLDQLHDRIDDLEQQCSRLQNDVVAKATAISGLEAELRRFQSTLRDTQEQLVTWQQHVQEKDMEIESLHGQVEALSTADLQSLQARYAKQIETLVAQHEAQIRAYEMQLRPQPAQEPRSMSHSFEARMTLDEISSSAEDTDDKPLLSPSYFQSHNSSPFQTPRRQTPLPAHFRRHSEGTRSSTPPNVRRRLLDNDVSMLSSSSAASSKASQRPSSRTPDRQAIVSRLHALVQESEERRKLEESRAEEDRVALEALKQRLQARQTV